MTKLSVNINKIATLRNARGGNLPDVEKAAVDCVSFGAEGITVHPRPDERHIRYNDVREIKPLINVELNIEGNPIPKFIELVNEIVPSQVTLVPDAADAITSNAGWDTIKNRDYLTDICKEFKARGIRTSIFIDPNPAMAEAAAVCGADRVELYTEAYAANYRAFKTLGCTGLSRVDFFVRKSDGRVMFNEINTIPGFTSISMYPKLMEQSGVPYPKLLDKLFKLAAEIKEDK